MSQTKKNSIIKLSIYTFLISLLFSSLVYESSGMTSALATLQEGKFSIAAMQLLSISYIAAISTALIIVIFHFGGQLLKPEFLRKIRNSNKNGQTPELVIVNPHATKEIIDNMNISIN